MINCPKHSRTSFFCYVSIWKLYTLIFHAGLTADVVAKKEYWHHPKSTMLSASSYFVASDERP